MRSETIAVNASETKTLVTIYFGFTYFKIKFKLQSLSEN